MNLNSIYFSKLTDKAEDIEEINEALEKAKAEVEGKNLSELELRKKLEKLYLEKIGIQLLTARTFNPMTTFGRNVLEICRQTQQEYEKSVGVLTTRVSANNADMFDALVTKDVLEDIKTQRLQAIGALRYHEGKVYAAGILAYNIDADRLEEGAVLEISWIYVAEQFREQGVATTLLGNIIDRCITFTISHIVADIPEDGEYTQAFYNMFSDWHFNFEEGFSPEFMLKLSKEKESDILVELSQKAKAIGGYTELKELMNDLSKTDARLRNILERKHFDEYFDQKTSCFVYDKDKKGGLLLTHRLPSGIIRTEYLGWTGKGGEYIKSLVSFLAVNAREVYGDGTIISLSVESWEMGYFLDDTFEEHLRIPVIEASLSYFLPHEDVDINAAIEILGDNLSEMEKTALES